MGSWTLLDDVTAGCAEDNLQCGSQDELQDGGGIKTKSSRCYVS